MIDIWKKPNKKNIKNKKLQSEIHQVFSTKNKSSYFKTNQDMTSNLQKKRRHGNDYVFSQQSWRSIVRKKYFLKVFNIYLPSDSDTLSMAASCTYMARFRIYRQLGLNCFLNGFIFYWWRFYSYKKKNLLVYKYF